MAMTAAVPVERSALVPELVVADLALSLAFWCDLIGFRVLYARPEERFAYLRLDGAEVIGPEVMLEERDPEGRQWLTGPFVPPLGNGINLQIAVPDAAAILARLQTAGWRLVLPPEDRWYRAGRVETGQRQFVVADPDGYLLRPAQHLGTRSFPAGDVPIDGFPDR